MSLISLVGAGRDFGLRPLFDGLDLHVGERERLGLIGPNGAGKSTLLKVLAGEEPLDRGERRLVPRLRVVRMEQEPATDPQATVLETVFAGGGGAAAHGPGGGWLVTSVARSGPAGTMPEGWRGNRAPK